jgi:hypothetical protein
MPRCRDARDERQTLTKIPRSLPQTAVAAAKKALGRASGGARLAGHVALPLYHRHHCLQNTAPVAARTHTRNGRCRWRSTPRRFPSFRFNIQWASAANSEVLKADLYTYTSGFYRSQGK